MTDGRAPEGAPGSSDDPSRPAADADSPTTQTPVGPSVAPPSHAPTGGAAVPGAAGTWNAPAQGSSPQPPPLAPLVDQAASPLPATSAGQVAPVVAPPPMAQPAVAWAPPPAAVPVVKPRRTVLAMVAGVLLLLGGIGGIIMGLLIVLAGGAFMSMFAGGGIPGVGEIPELEGADPATVLGGVIAVVGLILIAYSIAYLLAGIGVLRSSNWARVLGIIVGILSGLIWLSGIGGASGISDPDAAGQSRLFSIVMFAIHAYIVVALLLFWRNRSSSA